MNQPQSWIEGRFEENVMVTSVEQAINWARTGAMWPLLFGLACCAIEYMSTQARLSSACELTPLSISRRLENLATVPRGQRRYQPIG